MWEDEIVEEIRETRHKYAKKFNYDFKRIYADIKEQERKSGKTFVTLPPKRIKPQKPAIKSSSRLA